jgi:hypothetical protein
MSGLLWVISAFLQQDVELGFQALHASRAFGDRLHHQRGVLDQLRIGDGADHAADPEHVAPH